MHPMVGRTGLRKDQRWISLFETVSKLCQFSLQVKSNSCPKPWAVRRAENVVVVTRLPAQPRKLIGLYRKRVLCITILIAHL